MDVIVQCGSCKKSFRVDAQFGGRWVNCSACGEGILIPETAAPTSGDELLAGLEEVAPAAPPIQFAAPGQKQRPVADEKQALDALTRLVPGQPAPKPAEAPDEPAAHAPAPESAITDDVLANLAAAAASERIAPAQASASVNPNSCPRCGRPLPPGKRNCKRCGHDPHHRAAPPPAGTPAKKSRLERNARGIIPYTPYNNHFLAFLDHYVPIGVLWLVAIVFVVRIIGLWTFLPASVGFGRLLGITGLAILAMAGWWFLGLGGASRGVALAAELFRLELPGDVMTRFLTVQVLTTLLMIPFLILLISALSVFSFASGLDRIAPATIFLVLLYFGLAILGIALISTPIFSFFFHQRILHSFVGAILGGIGYAFGLCLMGLIVFGCLVLYARAVLPSSTTPDVPAPAPPPRRLYQEGEYHFEQIGHALPWWLNAAPAA